MKNKIKNERVDENFLLGDLGCSIIGFFVRKGFVSKINDCRLAIVVDFRFRLH